MRTPVVALVLTFALLPLVDVPLPGLNVSAAQASDYTVAVTGLCPGRMTLEWSGATPHHRQGILSSRYLGQWTIPVGQCRGTILGLAERVSLMKIIPTGEGSGSVSVTGSFGGICRAYVQLVEGGTCRTSNIARVP